MIPLSMPCLPSQHAAPGAPLRRARAVRGLSGLLLALLALPAMAQVSLTTLDVAYTQNFDTLPNAGAPTPWVDNRPPVPNALAGWYSVRSGSGTNIAVSTGSDSGGNL